MADLFAFRKMSFVFFITLVFLYVLGFAQSRKIHEVISPDGKIKAVIEVGEKVSYSLFCGQREVMSWSRISVSLDSGEIIGAKPWLLDIKRRSVTEKIIPAVREKRAAIPDHFNEAIFIFKGDYGIIFRAYDDGVAYRFFTKKKGKIKVVSEEASFHFSGDHSVYFPEVEGFHSSFERNYSYFPLSQVTSQKMAFLPVLVDLGDGPKVAITEADLDDYPGMYLRGSEDGASSLHGVFPPFPLKEEQERDRTLKVKEGADYIAETEGPREFPWRVIAVARTDGSLVESDIVYRLAKPCRIEDTSWIKPGKAAWDWWNANNIFGVDFTSGINTETYKYYIDFASKFGIEYVILDEGWSDTTDLLKVNPSIDLPGLLAYARERNVGIILWCVWLTLERQLEEVLDAFEKWGVKGIKVDFMDRDDQKVVNYYKKIAAGAAKRKLIVNFHGAFKPTGLRREYPNVLTREGVLGLEYSKWSNKVTPEHDLLIPFIRMLAGPMDFTPGAMANAAEKDFRPVFATPMSQGTRCHQLAMFVVYESPLQMLCDSPSRYLKEPDVMEFLARVPVIWDKTKVLEAKVGDYIVVARRKGEEWYVGAMTDWTPRELLLDFDFLGEGEYHADIYEDGVNASRVGSDTRKISRTVTRKDSLKISLAPGGGWAARLTKDY